MGKTRYLTMSSWAYHFDYHFSQLLTFYRPKHWLINRDKFQLWFNNVFLCLVVICTCSSLIYISSDMLVRSHVGSSTVFTSEQSTTSSCKSFNIASLMWSISSVTPICLAFLPWSSIKKPFSFIKHPANHLWMKATVRGSSSLPGSGLQTGLYEF